MFLGAIMLSFLIGGLVYDNYQKDLLLKEVETRLELIRDLRYHSLKGYVDTIAAEAVIWGSQDKMLLAFDELLKSWEESGPKASQELRRLYISDNPNPIGKKDELEDAGDGSSYSQAHRTYHPWLRGFLKNQGYYDVFLFDLRGNLIYTVFKEQDFGTNFLSGPYSGSGLGDVFREASTLPKGNIAFADFAAYEPSDGAPASFVGTPLMRNGERMGVLAFQVPSDRINDIMRFSAGMGKTGETYLVGGDFLMRSDSRFFENSTTLLQLVKTDASERAVRGEQGFLLVDDYRGTPVFSSFRAIEFHGLRWGLLSEIDEREAMAPLLRTRTVTAIALLLGFAAIAFIVVVVRSKALLSGDLDLKKFKLD
jgi:methyl-accepting chemotaxis protein